MRSLNSLFHLPVGLLALAADLQKDALQEGTVHCDAGSAEESCR